MRDGFPITRCRACSLLYVDAVLTPEALRHVYDSGYFTGAKEQKGYADYVGDKPTIVDSFERKLRRIARFKSPGAVLDVGCAAGYFLEAAARRGWDPHGLEISSYAYALAKAQPRLRVWNKTLSEAHFPPRSFDLITMWDVIEHLPQPKSDLRLVRRILKDDGLFIAATGNADSLFARLRGPAWHAFLPPQHLYFFSERTIRRLLAESGFEAVRVETAGKWLSLRYIVHIWRASHGGRLWDRLYHLLERSPLGRVALYLNLGDSMMVYARKNETCPVSASPLSLDDPDRT